MQRGILPLLNRLHPSHRSVLWQRPAARNTSALRGGHNSKNKRSPNNYEIFVAIGTVFASVAFVGLKSKQQDAQTDPSCLEQQCLRRKIEVANVLSAIQNAGITVVAIDFDNTLIDVHTGGLFYGDVTELQHRVRPCFRQLLPALLSLTTVDVAIVTFSPQRHIVRAVLESVVGPDQVNKIQIRGSSPLLYIRHGAPPVGKQAHIASLRTASFKKETTAQNPLLIDDSVMNIAIAKTAGMHAVPLDPDDSESLFEDILNELENV